MDNNSSTILAHKLGITLNNSWTRQYKQTLKYQWFEIVVRNKKIGFETDGRHNLDNIELNIENKPIVIKIVWFVWFDH